ncbi:uncharacterized protein LOC141698418 [Apium graveolens]|uniref:uncharacterized protein LOC141698418 n=1 Tax=Apium graveolens TaxID=4045 RepID=UPI003D7AC8F0
MESSIQEALRARDNAEKLFAVKDYSGAKNYALEAQMLCPGLEGISQMVATFEIYYAAQMEFGGEIDFYLILGLEPFCDKWTLKKQYKKMAVLLHPDKNKTVGADGAFKLVSEAFTLLSDNAKRRSYDQRRKKQMSCGVLHTNSSVHAARNTGTCSKSVPSHNRHDTFWTVCTSCHVQYEYLRKYVNKRLSCKNCRGVFIAVETGTAPVAGSFPYSPWPHAPDNGYGSHGCSAGTCIPASSVCFTGIGVTGHHSGHKSDCVPNTSLQWSAYPAGVVDHNGLATNSANAVHQTNGNVSRAKVNGKHHQKDAIIDMNFSGQNGYSEPTVTKLGRPAKKMKVEVRTATRNGNEEMMSKSELDVKLSNMNGNIKCNTRISTIAETVTKRYSPAPVFDARKMLIDKARTVIRNKLEEVKLASAAAALVEKNERALMEVGIIKDGPLHQQKLKKAVSVPISVPDSDFHDFDKDRSEECIQPKQIWALYDEEDGMPRLYCLIRQVISLQPFKVHISYLSSKTDTEFGLVNWLDSGFTKSCGHFRAMNTDILDQVNIFSHLLSREKAGRGGCVRIYPRRGDIWAVYRNWSTEWDSTTPDEVRHKYEMVEVLDDYSEELGIKVAPLIKLHGFKTVYQRNSSKDAIKWIPRREMLRFSHQVPFCVLKEIGTNLPDGCYDLDPAATPDELLQAAMEVQATKPHKMEDVMETPGEPLQPVLEITAEEKKPLESPTSALQDFDEMQVEKTPMEVLQDFSELQYFNKDQVEKTPIEVLQDLTEVQVEKTPTEVLQDLNEVRVERTPAEVLQDFDELFVEETPGETLHQFNEARTENKSSVEVLQDFNAFQVEKTPTEVLQDFNDVWVDKTPFEVLQDFNDMFAENLHYTDNGAATTMDLFNTYTEVQPQQKHHFWGESCAATPSELHPGVNKREEGKTYHRESCVSTSLEEQPVAELQFKSSKQMFHASNLRLFQDYPEVQEEKAPRQAEK